MQNKYSLYLQIISLEVYFKSINFDNLFQSKLKLFLDRIRYMTTYGIKKVSEIMDIPSSTLRYYEKIGLLQNVERDKNGLRVYNDEHLTRLEGIKCFKDGGLPIAKIREFYQYDDNLAAHIDDMIELVVDHEQNLAMQIKLMQKQLLHIQQKIRFYYGIKEAIDQHKLWPKFEDYAEIPAKTK